MPDTTRDDNRLHNLSPASRNEGPDSHKDNSKHMGKMYSNAANSNNANSKEDEQQAENTEDTGEDNEDNA